MRLLALFVIQLYQKTLSLDHGWLGQQTSYRMCNFTPSCSEYTKQAIMKHGLFKGIQLGWKRINRCCPQCAGGYDPVPE